MEKTSILVNIGKKKINLVIDKNSEKNEVLKMIKGGARIAFNYFNDVKNIKFDIELIYSRKEFNKKIGCKTEDWITAHSFGNRFIIFDPNKMEKFTTHKKDEFSQIVSHETSHVLLKKINTDFSTWMNEGIAQNISNQEQNKNIFPKNTNIFLAKSLFKNSNYEKFISCQGYEISYKLVKFLINNYNKKTVIKLLKVKYSDYESAEKRVCKILNINKENLIAKFREVLEKLNL